MRTGGQNYTRNEWKRCENSLEPGGKDVKTTLETSGKDVKTTLETSGKDVGRAYYVNSITTSVQWEHPADWVIYRIIMVKLHSKRVGKT
jgi:hypothetical protein